MEYGTSPNCCTRLNTQVFARLLHFDCHCPWNAALGLLSQRTQTGLHTFLVSFPCDFGEKPQATKKKQSGRRKNNSSIIDRVCDASECLWGGVTCGAEALLRPVVYGQIPVNWDAVILQGQMGGLVPLVIGATQGHGGEQVEAYLAVGLGILDRCTVFGRFQLVCIEAWDRWSGAGYEMLIFLCPR